MFGRERRAARREDEKARQCERAKKARRSLTQPAPMARLPGPGLFLLAALAGIALSAATTTTDEDVNHPPSPHGARPATRAAAALAGRPSLPPSELAAHAPWILPPRLVASPLTQAELTRLLFLFGVPPGSDVNASVLTSMASDRPRTFMALADASKNGTGVVNREHEYPEWAARGDAGFNLSAYGGVPPSVDRVFAAGDWLGDERHGVNVSAATRLGLGEPGAELMLALDSNGDRKLNNTELSQRAPADVPLSPSFRHHVYAYTAENGEALAGAALRAFDGNHDWSLDASEAENYALALRRVRMGNATATRDARRLAAALVDGGDAGTLTSNAVSEYTRRAATTGAMAIVPPGQDAGVWFRNVTGGRDRVSVAEFVG